MKRTYLTTTVAILMASSVVSANAANEVVNATTAVTESAGNALTNTSDNIYTALTGRTVNKVDVQHPVSLYAYDQASSAYESGYFTGRFNTNKSKDSKSSYDLKLNSDYDRVFSSANANTGISIDANADTSNQKDENGDKKESWNIKASANHDRYFNPATSKAFWYGQGDIEFQNELDDDYAGWSNPATSVTAGLGYGRVVNVTPMAEAMRVVEALNESGAMKGTPSAQAYNQIAQIISKKGEYESKYSTNYRQKWIGDIERAIGKNLGAAGALKIYDVLENDKLSTRRYGWDVRAGLGAQLTTFNGKNDDIDPTVKAMARYYYPFSNQTQFSNVTTLGSTLDSKDDAYNVSNVMGLTYEVSDRVDWLNSWTYGYTKAGDSDASTHKLSSSYLYDISNSLQYDATLTYSFSDVNGTKDNQTGFTTGVRYRFK